MPTIESFTPFNIRAAEEIMRLDSLFANQIRFRVTKGIFRKFSTLHWKTEIKMIRSNDY